jgi:hypothetical protein
LLGERGATEVRIDTAVADGHCQAVGELKSPECWHHGAVVGDSVKYPADGLVGLVTINPSVAELSSIRRLTQSSSLSDLTHYREIG